MRLLVPLFYLLISVSVHAEGLAPKAVEISGSLVSVNFDLSHLEQDCGLRVLWGDGSESKVRVGRDVDENDFTLTHQYDTDGPFILEAVGEKIIRGLGTVFACPSNAYKQIVNLGSEQLDKQVVRGIEPGADGQRGQKELGPSKNESGSEQTESSVDQNSSVEPRLLGDTDLPEVVVPKFQGDLYVDDKRGPWEFEAYCEKKTFGKDIGHYVFRHGGVPVRYTEGKVSGGCAHGISTASWVRTEITNRPHLFPPKTVSPDQIRQVCSATLAEKGFDPLRQKLNIESHRIYKDIPLKMRMDDSYISGEEFDLVLLLSELVSDCNSMVLESLIYQQSRADEQFRVLARKTINAVDQGVQKVLLALLRKQMTYGEANDALTDFGQMAQQNLLDDIDKQMALNKKLEIARENAARAFASRPTSSPSKAVSGSVFPATDASSRIDEIESKLKRQENNRSFDCIGRGGVYINGVCN